MGCSAWFTKIDPVVVLSVNFREVDSLETPINRKFCMVTWVTQEFRAGF